MNTKKNVFYFNVLNVFSAIAVVYIHINDCFWKYSNDIYWRYSCFVHGFFFFAVPIFFMLTGAKLIDYSDKYSTKEFFKKRFLKTVIPFISWNIIGFLFRKFYYLKDFAWSDFKYVFFYSMLNGTEICITFWFFIPLFMIYLSIPLFSAVNKNKKIPVFSFIVLVGIIINNIFPFIAIILHIDMSKAENFVYPITSMYVIYVLLGYLLHNCEIKKTFRYIMYISGIASLIFHIAFTYVSSINSNMVVDTLKDYFLLPNILYSTAIFVFIKYNFNQIKNKYFCKFINFLNKYTFAIYLSHTYVRIAFDTITKFYNTSSMLYHFFVPFIVIAICILITMIIRKIPIIKNILP